ncbi:diaminopimelate decarboxylase [Orrella sp. 11846]|uniref:diaminopimelate decarboxylase n=1 Tax=Orrella sp. 11846 TaxID=3409913 RepID=UPI003B59660C
MSPQNAPSTPPTPAGQPFFHFDQNRLFVESIELETLAKQYGTPLYVYSRAAIEHAWQSYARAIESRKALICYGMKANSNLAILQLFAKLGSGFDIVSGGELARVLKAGGDPSKVVFSGVGKQIWEMEAALKAGVKCFNVESVAELKQLSEVATRLNIVAPVSLRVNPDVDPHTHPYISTGLKENKFGIAIEEAVQTYQYASELPNLNITGLDCHIGSQITEISPYLDALDKLIILIKALSTQGITLQHLDIGGGLGIRYHDETPIDPADLINTVFERLTSNGLGDLELVMEPGRSLVGNAGVLLTQVIFLKPAEQRSFAIVDAAMNDLMRPALYEAWHGVLPLKLNTGAKAQTWDVVGPICESADWLAKERTLAIEQNDYLVIESTGAYSFVMSGQYNSRTRAAEILVDGDQVTVIRERETFDDLIRGENLLDL